MEVRKEARGWEKSEATSASLSIGCGGSVIPEGRTSRSRAHFKGVI